MELKINIEKAVTELAKEAMIKWMINYHDLSFEAGDGDKEVNALIYKDNEVGETTYTEEAQDVFNTEYEEIFNTLTKYKV